MINLFVNNFFKHKFIISNYLINLYLNFEISSKTKDDIFMQCMHSVFTIEMASTDENHPDFNILLFLFFSDLSFDLFDLFDLFLIHLNHLNKPTMLIKLFLLKKIIFLYDGCHQPLQNSPTIFPYKYNTNLHLIFIHKSLSFQNSP